MEHIIVTCSHGGQIYSLTYILASLTGMGIFIISSVRNGFSLHKVLLITAGITLFFLVGTKLFAVSPKEWISYLVDGSGREEGRKTILGGLLGILVAGILMARWTGTSLRVFDHLAVGLPLGMAINRIGCFFAGCCFGSPSALPWAVIYPQHSHAFLSQLSGGLVRPQDLTSLPVHPTQLYDMFACLLIALIIQTTRHIWKATGTRLLMALMLYTFARFIIEFFRDPVTDPYTSGIWMGIKTVQWTMVIAMMVLGAIVFLREKTFRHGKTDVEEVDAPIGTAFALLGILVIVSLALHSRLDIVEMTILLLTLLPAMFSTIAKTLGHLFQSGYLWKTTLITGCCFILMSQTYIPTDNLTRVSYFEGGLAGIFGQYRDFTGKAYQGTDCEGDTYYSFNDLEYQKYKYKLMGISGSYNERYGPYNRFTFKMSAFAGKEDGEVLDSGVVFSHNVYSINPGISYSWRYAGIDAGFHAGRFTYAHFDGPTNRLAKWVFKHNEDKKPNHMYNFMPQIGLRLGPQNIIYVDGQFANSLPMSSPLMRFSVGLGSGLGKWDGTNLGVGFCPAGLYVSTTLPVKEKYVVYFLLSDNFQGGSVNRYTISFALSYRFAYKEKVLSSASPGEQ